MPAVPTLRREREFLREGRRCVAGMDEVGRGAIAGPVSVGVVVVVEGTRTAPRGVRDSKLLPAATRQALAPRIRKWAAGHAVGHASADEIDRWGIMIALRLAGLRALTQCGPVDLVLLDGSFDWLGRQQEPLFDDVPWPVTVVPDVATVIKGDRTCSSVAAASVIAKVTRDAIMTGLHRGTPCYAWHENKGYSTPDHAAAIREHGLSGHHRSSWQLSAAGIDVRDHPPAVAAVPSPGVPAVLPKS